MELGPRRHVIKFFSPSDTIGWSVEQKTMLKIGKRALRTSGERFMTYLLGFVDLHEMSPPNCLRLK